MNRKAMRKQAAKRKPGVLHRARNRCEHCGSKNELTVDHIIPLSRGGSSHPSNLQSLCRKCNEEKGSMTNEEYKLAKKICRYDNVKKRRNRHRKR